MPRQPYSEAVPSSGGGGYNLSSLREERLGEKGGAFLKGKEGRVGFRKTPFAKGRKRVSKVHTLQSPHNILTV